MVNLLANTPNIHSNLGQKIGSKLMIVHAERIAPKSNYI